MLPDVHEYIEALKSSRKFGPQVVYHRRIEARDARYCQFPEELPTILCQSLNGQFSSGLYSHQAQAIASILGKKSNIVVATATASGKSSIFSIPVALDLLREIPGHCLYLSPLKALAQDQAVNLTSFFNDVLGGDSSLQRNLCAIFDGDLSTYQRNKIRQTPPRILLTNPEMLHLSILPHHHSWAHFLGNLRYVVLDEVHSYRGVLGSHMAWVLRRLQRLTAYYGGAPIYILLSATIGNPLELAQQLLAAEAQVFTDSGAPSAEKNFLFLNPWDSAAHTASQLLEAAVKRGLRTIVYTQSRKLTELISMWTAPRLGALGQRVSAYRAGFLPEERREIEQQLHSGALLGVISTSALELGIDIGDLDLCLLVGYPGSIMSTMQRGGRVGRGQQPSATILISGEDALDQYYMRNPEEFFNTPPESAVLNPENESIMSQHLLCTAAELPLDNSEPLLTSKYIARQVAELTGRGELLLNSAGDMWFCSRKRPQRHVSLRGGGRTMSIIDKESGEIIGEIDAVRGMKECYPGAVYLHRSKTYVVEKFDLERADIIVELANPNYFTRPLADKHTEILEVRDVKTCFGTSVSYGMVRVTERVTGYQKRNNRTQKLIATIALEMPEQIMETEGVWLEIDTALQSGLQKLKYHFMGAIHALEHALIAHFPLLVLCDRNDIGGISCPSHEQVAASVIFIYDGYPGGVGLSASAFIKMTSLLQKTMKTLQQCQCENGCPACVHSPKCGSGNRPIDKQACMELLKQILAAETVPGAASLRQPSMYPMQIVQPDELPQGLDCLPENFVVFDLETKYSAEEVGGWHRASKMGVSLVVLYDGRSGEYQTYLEDELAVFIEKICQSDLVVGFNNKRFDNQVLSAYCDSDLSALPTLDLLEEVHNYLGYRLSLNRLAEVTLQQVKSGDGLQALRWYKEGRMDLIREYCRKDVEITKNLLFYALENGYLLFCNKAKQEVRLPLALDARINSLVR